MDKQEFLNFLDDLRFDSKIFILGINDYITELKKIITEKNIVYIFEVDNDKYFKYKHIENDNIKLLLFSKETLTEVLKNNISTKNFLNFYASVLDGYGDIYYEEEEIFYSLLDYYYDRCRVFASTFKTFKRTYFENFLSNVSHLDNSICFDNLLGYYQNNPALIVSAGPSLDDNLKDLIKYKDKLEYFTIICGNRTLKPLIENNIIPDFIVSIDPQDITYNMIKDYCDLDIPLIFFEHSNSNLVKHYNGPKVYTTQGTFLTIEGLEEMLLCFAGGSVAHSMTHLACCLGCEDIIFLGQDFAFTNNKFHGECANFNNVSSQILGKMEIENVFNEIVYTDMLLTIYKNAMEHYIENVNADINFINSSKGAKIKGADFIELENILTNQKYHTIKPNFEDISHTIKPQITSHEYLKNLKQDLNKYIGCFTVHKSILNNICTNKYSLSDSTTNFYKMTADLGEFFNNSNTIAYRGYVEDFLFDIKEKYFSMKAKDYNTLKENIFYQSSTFIRYLDELLNLLIEINLLIEKKITQNTF